MGSLGLWRARRAVGGGRQSRVWGVALVGACAALAGTFAFLGPVPPWGAGQPRAASRPTGSGDPGKAVYGRHCATCHGASGGSDGPGADALPIKPPPLTNGRLLNPLSDEFLVTIVRDGAAAVGLAPQMPAFGRLLTDREIRDVVGFVRTLAQPPYQPRAGPTVQPIAPAPVQPIEFSH